MHLNVHRSRAIDIHPPFSCIWLISVDLASRFSPGPLRDFYRGLAPPRVRACAAGVATGLCECCVRIRCDRACAGAAASTTDARPLSDALSFTRSRDGCAVRRRRADRQRRDGDRHRDRDPRQEFLPAAGARRHLSQRRRAELRPTPRSALPSTTRPHSICRPAPRSPSTLTSMRTAASRTQAPSTSARAPSRSSLRRWQRPAT
ncbi:hypothetical protein ACVWWP_002764 [Bradyrhizobium sp. LM3.6]